MNRVNDVDLAELFRTFRIIAVVGLSEVGQWGQDRLTAFLV